VQTELASSEQWGTWELVNKPVDAVPISNKWVFNKKYTKASDLLKLQGRLVAKGWHTTPGYDYQETFSPVVWLGNNTRHIGNSCSKRLKIQQADVKEVYLNSNLKEKVYMCQLEGFYDRHARSVY